MCHSHDDRWRAINKPTYRLKHGNLLDLVSGGLIEVFAPMNLGGEELNFHMAFNLFGQKMVYRDILTTY